MTSYPKLYTLGHPAVRDIFLDDVEIEEKIDGSQFTFGVQAGELVCFSKRCKLHLDGPIPDLFRGCVSTAKRLFDEGRLTDGWLYRGEAIARPQHNTLCYGRVPKGNVILFDVMTGPEDYASHAFKSEVAEGLGLEVVPLIFKGKVEYVASLLTLQGMLNRVSILGAQNIEGLVFKNYGRFGLDKKPLFAKYVSEAFKEVHQGEWRKQNPNKKDIIEQLVEQYTTPARWQKAIQHLREAGKITDSPKDIGPLIGEICRDVHEECTLDIAAKLMKWGWPQIARGLVRNFPQWYKEELAKSQFEGAA